MKEIVIFYSSADCVCTYSDKSRRIQML